MSGVLKAITLILKIDKVSRILLLALIRMNFCEKCDNLYGFITNEDEDGHKWMTLRCQACGNQSEIKQNMQIYAKQFVSRTHDMPVDPDLQYDHTLTRTSLVKCLNDKCPTNAPNVPPCDTLADKVEDMSLSNKYSVTDIVIMARANQTTEQIIEKLRTSKDKYFLDTRQWVQLYESGVPGEVITFMRSTTSESSSGIVPKCEVATYQYNSESGKLGYICLVCHHYWKNL